jgi:hypothetical protein
MRNKISQINELIWTHFFHQIKLIFKKMDLSKEYLVNKNGTSILRDVKYIRTLFFGGCFL